MKLLLITAILCITASVSLGCCYTDLTGRIFDEYDRPVNGAIVQITGCFSLPCKATYTRITRSNTFGYFKIRDVLLTEYVLQVNHRRKGSIEPTLLPIYETNYIEVILQKERINFYE